MINANYLKYLFKSKKFLIGFIFLIMALISVNALIHANQSNNYSLLVNAGVIFVLGVMLSFIMPCLTFSYIHDKKAVDTYYSLPVDRKQLLTTGLLFNLTITYIPVFLSMLIILLPANLPVGRIAILLLSPLLIYATLSVVNTLFYHTANSIVDGIIMIAAYSVIPLAIFVAISAFTDTFVAGSLFGTYNFAEYLSPIYLSFVLFLNHLNLDRYYPLETFDYQCIVILVVMLIIALVILYKASVARKAERAGTISTGFFAYRFITYFYTFVCVFGIGTMFSYDYDLGEYFSSSFFLYLGVFALFVIAHFIYKRKFYLNFRLPLYYLGIIVACIIFMFVARSTKGFGLAYAYEKPNQDTYYTVYQNHYYNPIKLDDIAEWFYKQTDGKSLNEDYNYIQLDITSNRTITKPYLQSTIDILEAHRKDSINYFYSGDSRTAEYGETNTNMYIYQNKDRFGNYRKTYHYYGNTPFTLEEILTLAKDTNLTIHIYSFYEYVLTPDGQLVRV